MVKLEANIYTEWLVTKNYLPWLNSSFYTDYATQVVVGYKCHCKSPSFDLNIYVCMHVYISSSIFFFPAAYLCLNFKENLLYETNVRLVETVYRSPKRGHEGLGQKE